MAVTADIATTRYGTAESNQLLSKGIQATVTIYRGTIALLNGTGANAGYLKDNSVVASTDIVLGILAGYSSGNADVQPGMTGGSTNGAVKADIHTGSFIVASGTGSDALTVATNGQTVYVIDQKTVGATNGGSTRPTAGVQLSCNTDDPSIPVGFVAVKFNTVGGP